MKYGRNEIIRMVLDAYDTIDTLEFENTLLRKRVDTLESAEPDEIKKLCFIDEKVIEFGRKKLLESTLSYWRDVSYTIDDDTGDVSIEDFERWRERVVQKSHIPSWCSVDEFFYYFDVYLRSIYDEEREKTVAEAKSEGK